jgi:3-oxoacyl-[acyl-carrier-protein] synthase II
MSAASSLGLDLDSIWKQVVAGETGFRLVEELPAGDDYKTRVWADVDKQALRRAVLARGMKKADPTLELAMLVTHDALQQAGLLDPDHRSGSRMGAVFGCGAGMVNTQTEAYLSYYAKGLRGVRPTTVPRCMMNYLSAQISLGFGLKGPNQVIVAACSSSTIAIGQSARMIRDGYLDQMVCGGSEALLEPALFAAWDRLGIMDRSNDPARACRPFDEKRGGTILGEGAGALVLEEREQALSRGATILGEVLGYGESSDASHLVQPSPDGQLEAMQLALADAGISVEELDCISAQGTATELNDAAESVSITRLLGDRLPDVPAFSMKSYLGHLLGASGAVESVLLFKAMKEGALPPNLNLDKPDPSCNLNLVRENMLEGTFSVAMKNSFAFGGSNAVLILGQGSEDA